MKHLSNEQLNEYLDHESQDRTQIESHLAVCDECGARLAALQALFSELDSLPDAALAVDLAPAVIQRVGGSAVLPKWLTLTVFLQAALALVILLIATPFVIEFASVSLPLLQVPSIPEVLLPLQSQWMSWLDTLATFQMPVLPAIPTPQFSSMVIGLTLAAASIFWLVGNGLLLRNQIK
jgi:anti-sigma factor RsiW